MYSSPIYLVDQKADVLLVDTSLDNKYRWSPVYARKLTINKGVDNILQFQFLNQEQKPVDISNFAFAFKLISNDSQTLLISKIAEKVNPRLGTVRVVVTSADTNKFDAQPASWSIVRVGAGSVNNITVVDGGWGYQSAPQVVISPLAGQSPTINASANAFITGRLNDIIITSGGSGYLSAPNVVISNGLSSIGVTANATAYANLTFGVGFATILNPGTGYNPNTVAISFEPPIPTNIANILSITGNSTLGYANVIFDNPTNTKYFTIGSTVGISGVLTTPAYNGRWQVSNASSNWVNITTTVTGPADVTSAPAVIGNVTNAITATGNVVLDTNGSITDINILTPGRGYTTPPNVFITGSNTDPAQANTTLTGSVNRVTIVNRGQGYINPPTVSFTGGFGSGAQAVASTINQVYLVQLNSAGAGYTAAPTVSFVGGNPSSDAQATASISAYPYQTAAFVDDAASARGEVDIVDGPYPAFNQSKRLTLPPFINMTVAGTPTANIYFAPVANTSVISTQGASMLTFAINCSNFTGQLTAQGSPDQDNDLIWYQINEPYYFNQYSGWYSFNIRGFHPYVRLHIAQNGNANIALIDTHITDILYR